MDTTTAEYTEFIKIRDALAHQREFDCVEDKLLGKGAFGHVVKAKKEGKLYAIKLLPMYEGKRVKYQERELKALAKLNLSEESKRNIIEYFNAWILKVGDTQKLCIQMELCSVDLETFVFMNTNFAPHVTKAQGSPQFYQHVFQQILNGLVVIHSIGWIHRDIHPGNILVVNPNPQQTSDIHIKIADFGLARNIRDMEIELKLSAGWTIHPEFEQCTPYAGHGLYTARELLTTTYDYKVDIYSAGTVLYFISLYPEDKKEWITELSDLRQDKVDTKDRLIYDDDQLHTLIKDMLRLNPHERPTAREAKEYMFPEANDSTDSSETQKIKFFVRKEDERDLRKCYLNNLTLSALKAEVERRTGIRQGQLRQEDIINGKEKRIIIDDDEDVENIFQDAAQERRDIVIVVIHEHESDNNRTECGQISSGDITMSSDETL